MLFVLAMTLLTWPVMAACLCRLKLLNPKTDKLGWGAMYLAMFAYAIGLWAEAADSRTWPGLLAWLGLAVIALNLALTWHQWLLHNHRVPPIAQRQPPPQPDFADSIYDTAHAAEANAQAEAKWAQHTQRSRP